MGINFKNFLSSQQNNNKMGDYQNLDHLDGVAISTISANLYNSSRDDMVMFYFRDGANFASLYTQSKIISENIKWNLNNKVKKISSLVVNTRNANCFTGKVGYKSLEKIAEIISEKLNEKQKIDEDQPKKIKPKEIILINSGEENIENEIHDKIAGKKIKLIYIHRKLSRVSALNLAIDKSSSEFSMINSFNSLTLTNFLSIRFVKMQKAQPLSLRSDLQKKFFKKSIFFFLDGLKIKSFNNSAKSFILVFESN